jgi:hypothetical protein
MGVVGCALLARDDSVLHFINWRTRVNTISLIRQHLTSVEPFPSILTSSVFMTQRSSLALPIKYIVVVRPYYDLQLFTTFWPSSSLPRLLATFKFGWLFHLENCHHLWFGSEEVIGRQISTGHGYHSSSQTSMMLSFISQVFLSSTSYITTRLEKLMT